MQNIFSADMCGEVEVILPEFIELGLQGALGAQGLHAPALELLVPAQCVLAY